MNSVDKESGECGLPKTFAPKFSIVVVVLEAKDSVDPLICTVGVGCGAFRNGFRIVGILFILIFLGGENWYFRQRILKTMSWNLQAVFDRVDEVEGKLTLMAESLE